VSQLRVLSVASEIYPIVKTGGLADVVGALPKALAAEHIAVTTLVPGYRPVLKSLEAPAAVLTLPDFFGGEARIVAGSAAGLQIFALDAPHLYARAGNIYSGPDGLDWSDNAFRFAALARAAAALGRGAIEGFAPDVIHAHDWQAGLTPAYLHYAGVRRPATVMTVHNLAFQGQFAASLLPALGFPSSAYAVDGLEYYGTISFLKGGLQFADRITTVSPTYAVEIATRDAGMGLDGLLRSRASIVSGILNGIDDEVWNPATDTTIPAHYTASKLHARAANTAALQARFGLTEDPQALVIGVISRFSWQKGLDLLLASLPRLLETGAQLAVLGAGDADLEAAFADAAARNAGRIGCFVGYDEALAHLVQAGAGALLVPSRFEPCGLTQLCALRYGAVPVVARVGGLADTVIDASEMAVAARVGTGVQFAPPTQEMLEAALARTAALHREPATWKRLQTNGMKTDVSWRHPARRYANLYRELVRA
jgi:starch synthase